MANRSEIIMGTAALLIFSAGIAYGGPQSQNNSQTQAQSTQDQSQGSTTQNQASPPVQAPMSLGEAARKAREQNKPAHPAKTFTNDDLPKLHDQGLSTVGPPAAGSSAAPDEGATATSKPKEEAKDEKYWRRRFADIRAKIADTEKEIDVLQRELNLAQQEYYANPSVALQQQHSREDINKKTDAINEKKQVLAEQQQQLSDLQDELRRAGGDAAWGR